MAYEGKQVDYPVKRTSVSLEKTEVKVATEGVPATPSGDTPAQTGTPNEGNQRPETY